MMQQRSSLQGPDPLDESMDNMESLILNPPDFDSGSAYGSAVSGSASQSYLARPPEDDDDALESDFQGFGQGSGHHLEPPSYTEALNAPPSYTEALNAPPSYSDALNAPRVSAASSTPSSSSGGISPHSGEASAAGGPDAGASSASSSGGPAAGRPFLTVRVGDPQKHLDSSSSSMLPGGGTYVSYAVTTTTNLPEFGASGRFKVRRRFKEFVALADRMAETHRGYFVPARPDKSIVENQLMAGKDFVDMRKVELEKYLMRLAKHPALQRSRELVVFLTAEGKLPLFPKPDMASRVLEGVVKLPGQLLGAGPAASSVPGPAEAAQPASGGRDLLRMFKELRQSVANEWTGNSGGAGGVVGGVGTPGDAGAGGAGGAGAGGVPGDPSEQAFSVRKHKLEELEKHLMDASIQAENLVRAQADLTRVTGNLGLSFLALSKLEQRCAGDPLPGSTPGQQEAQRQLAEACRAGGSVLVRESRLQQQAVSESISQLAQLHEYLKGMQAARAAFADRTQAVVTVQTLTGDLASKRGKLERLNAGGPRPGDISRVKKAIEIEEEIDKATKAKAAAEAELERIKLRNAEEFDRFDCERWEDMSWMLEGFTQIQAVASERTAQLWESAADTRHVHAKGKSPV